MHAKIDFLGIISEGVGFTDSQSASNQQTDAVEVSHFRNTVVTADNQRAIGRAYWGPLGDLFVILVSPRFAVSRRADGTLFYSMESVQQIIIAPAWKLLRPGDDPIVSAIPEDARRRMLQLDPFIQSLDRFFPDSGADLSLAANSYADPSRNNRAELIGRWWLDTGSELTYSQGETHQLFSTETNQVSYDSTVTINASAGVNYDGLALALGLTANYTTSVGYQTSKETSLSSSKSASCLLIHNQNERDLAAIDLFYDKVFSTFMFRRVRAHQRTVVGGPPSHYASVAGRVLMPNSGPLSGAPVVLRNRSASHETSTTATGRYVFVNVATGRYVLEVGDHREHVELGKENTAMQPAIIDIDGVRRKLDLQRAPVWELRQALGVPSDVVQRICAHLADIRSVASVARLAGVDRAATALWNETVLFRFAQPQSRASHAGRRRPGTRTEKE